MKTKNSQHTPYLLVADCHSAIIAMQSTYQVSGGLLLPGAPMVFNKGRLTCHHRNLRVLGVWTARQRSSLFAISVVGRGVVTGYVSHTHKQPKEKCLVTQAGFIFHTLSNAHGKFLWSNHHWADVLCVLLVFPYWHNRLWFYSQSSKRGREHQASRDWLAAFRRVDSHHCRYAGCGSSDGGSYRYQLSDSRCWRCCGWFESKQPVSCWLWHPHWICLVHPLCRNYPRYTRQLQENTAEVSKEKRV